MSLTQLAIIFASTFAAASFLLFTDIIRDALKSLRRRPEQPHVVLGNDMRGRTAQVVAIDADGQRCCVQIGAERWRGELSGSSKMGVGVGDKVVIKKINGLTLHVQPAVR